MLVYVIQINYLAIDPLTILQLYIMPPKRKRSRTNSSSSSRRHRRTNSEELTPNPQQLPPTRGSAEARRVTTATTSGIQGQSNNGRTPADLADGVLNQHVPSLPRRRSLQPELNPPADHGINIELVDNAAAPPPPPPPPQLQQQQPPQEEEVDPSIVYENYNAGQFLKFSLSSTIVDIDDDDDDGSWAIKLENVRSTLYTDGALLLAINNKPLHEVCASMGGISMNQDRHAKRNAIMFLLMNGELAAFEVKNQETSDYCPSTSSSFEYNCSIAIWYACYYPVWS